MYFLFVYTSLCIGMLGCGICMCGVCIEVCLGVCSFVHVQQGLSLYLELGW